ncbi:MAG: hypothetical protein IPN77_15010 [Sandaracinaceae bacterium]|nr:hypothetical protein [Sandaracinaceae bacterium]
MRSALEHGIARELMLQDGGSWSVRYGGSRFAGLAVVVQSRPRLLLDAVKPSAGPFFSMPTSASWCTGSRMPSGWSGACS